MATYVLGDIQGCFHSLQTLLQKIKFDARQDRLWCVGDLVNRGAKSLEVLRWAKGLDDRLVAVLGNHDLHLLGRYWNVQTPKAKDTLEETLTASDGGELIHWLRERPFFYREGNRLLVHAGLLPQWDLETVEAMAHQAQQTLLGKEGPLLLKSLSGKSPLHWSPDLTGRERLKAFVKILTRMRVCTASGTVDFRFTGPPGEAPLYFKPWYAYAHRRPPETTVFCGHWSALGVYRSSGVTALDSGCVWGGRLSAYGLEEGRLIQVEKDPRDGNPEERGN